MDACVGVISVYTQHSQFELVWALFNPVYPLFSTLHCALLSQGTALLLHHGLDFGDEPITSATVEPTTAAIIITSATAPTYH